MTHYQRSGASSRSRVVVARYPWRCFACICDGPTGLWRNRFWTAPAISSPWVESLMGNISTPTGILSPGEGMRMYSATLYSIILVMEMHVGGSGRLVVDLYHPHIWRHIYFTRGG